MFKRNKESWQVLCSECFQVHVGYACEIGHDFHKLVYDPGVPR